MNRRKQMEWEQTSGQKIARSNPNVRAKLEEITAIVAQCVPLHMQDKLLKDLRGAKSKKRSNLRTQANDDRQTLI